MDEIWRENCYGRYSFKKLAVSIWPFSAFLEHLAVCLSVPLAAVKAINKQKQTSVTAPDMLSDRDFKE